MRTHTHKKKEKRKRFQNIYFLKDNFLVKVMGSVVEFLLRSIQEIKRGSSYWQNSEFPSPRELSNVARLFALKKAMMEQFYF